MQIHYGMLVIVNGGKKKFHNVTEVHYGYEAEFGSNRIAIESNIHATGLTLDFLDVNELEVFPEDKLHRSFEEL